MTEALRQSNPWLDYAKRHLALRALSPAKLVDEIAQTHEYDRGISVILEKPAAETDQWHDAYVAILALRNSQH